MFKPKKKKGVKIKFLIKTAARNDSLLQESERERTRLRLVSPSAIFDAGGIFLVATSVAEERRTKKKKLFAVGAVTQRRQMRPLARSAGLRARRHRPPVRNARSAERLPVRGKRPHPCTFIFDL